VLHLVAGPGDGLGAPGGRPNLLERRIVGRTRETLPMSELPMCSGSTPSSTRPAASRFARQRPARTSLSFIVVEPPEKTASPSTSAIIAAPATRARIRSRIDS